MESGVLDARAVSLPTTLVEAPESCTARTASRALDLTTRAETRRGQLVRTTLRGRGPHESARFAASAPADSRPREAARVRPQFQVTPHSRLVWTNCEGGNGAPVTTVTSEEKVARRCWSCTTPIPRRKRSTPPAPAADAMRETFEQLDELFVTLGASVGRS
jgi:hypothetical protein